MQQKSELERMADEFQSGRVELGELINCFLGSTVAMPSATDPATDGIQPVLFSHEGDSHIVIAASEAALDQTKDHAAFALTVSGQDVVRGLAPGTGVLVNTSEGSFALPPALLGQLRDYLASSQTGVDQ